MLGLGNYAQNALRIRNNTLTLDQSLNFCIIETDLKEFDVENYCQVEEMTLEFSRSVSVNVTFQLLSHCHCDQRSYF